MHASSKVLAVTMKKSNQPTLQSRFFPKNIVYLYQGTQFDTIYIYLRAFFSSKVLTDPKDSSRNSRTSLSLARSLYGPAVSVFRYWSAIVSTDLVLIIISHAIHIREGLCESVVKEVSMGQQWLVLIYCGLHWSTVVSFSSELVSINQNGLVVVIFLGHMWHDPFSLNPVW